MKATARTIDREDDARVTRCFLCDPEPALVYAESDRFFAMLGLGPITEGYSLIAARAHVPSMLDLPSGHRKELVDFTALVRERLDTVYGPATVTEHGRVPPCLERHALAHEPHCLHAHRLVFPNSPQLDLTEVAPALVAHEFGSFLGAAVAFRDPGQYLYLENPDGTCQLASVHGPFPRQFFRRVVAATVGALEVSDWQAHPRHEVISLARERLRAAG
jgi:hypothetical protein